MTVELRMKCLFVKAVIVAAGISFLLALSNIVYAQESELVLSEERVKSSIEEIATMYICSDKLLLDSVNVDARKCQIAAVIFAESCWESIDKLVESYEISGIEQGEQKFQNITDVYIQCMEAKLLRASIRRPDQE